VAVRPTWFGRVGRQGCVKTEGYGGDPAESGVVTIHLPLRDDARTAIDAPSVVRIPGGRLAATLWGGLAVVDLATLAHSPAYLDLGLVAVLVGAASLRMRTGTGLANAFIGWLLVDGFVTHRYGELGYAGPPDLARLGLLVAVAVLATRVHR
jgi:hypothetical protein